MVSPEAMIGSAYLHYACELPSYNQLRLVQLY